MQATPPGRSQNAKRPATTPPTSGPPTPQPRTAWTPPKGNPVQRTAETAAEERRQTQQKLPRQANPTERIPTEAAAIRRDVSQTDFYNETASPLKRTKRRFLRESGGCCGGDDARVGPCFGSGRAAPFLQPACRQRTAFVPSDFRRSLKVKSLPHNVGAFVSPSSRRATCKAPFQPLDMACPSKDKAIDMTGWAGKGAVSKRAFGCRHKRFGIEAVCASAAKPHHRKGLWKQWSHLPRTIARLKRI